MGHKKGKKKEIIALILLLIVLCSGVVTGLILFNQKNNDKVTNEDTDIKKPVDKTEVSKVTSNQYTVMVKSDTGVVLPNVLVAIYDAKGNMITQPEATDAVGRLIYTPEEEGTFGACVMAAPHQYALDREIHYFESGENLLSIVLEEDPTAFVAKIGDMNYTLRDAITAANASSEDVTITLLHDVYIVSDTYLNNKSGKTITIDGGGKKVTYLANSTLFSISQKAGTVNFKNMTIEHNGAGAVFRTSNAINLNLTDVTILAQNDTEGFYKWSLINLFGKGKTNLTMTRVKIDMDITTIEKDASGASVIRTGNEGNVKDIKITMNDCYIDATGAKGRAGIRVTPDTTANVVLNNTTFLTQNNYVIAVDGQLTWSQKNSTLGSKDEYYNEHPVPDVIATVGKAKFYSLNAAVKEASKLGGKEPVKLVGDITLFNSTTFSGDGITAIIDGNGHTLTTEGGNTIFKINANNYKLTFRNLKINHGGYERLLQYEAKKENIDVTWENVTVVASGTSEDACYKYGLMNLRGSGSFTMKSSSITLDVPKIINGSAPGVIRTGNANDGQKLTISLDNSKIDASKTSGAYGIYVQKGVTTDIILKKYEIHTNNRYPIYVHADDGDATLTYDNMHTWSSKSSNIGWLCNLVSLLNLEDAAMIGNTRYVTLSEAFEAAQAAGGNVTIKLLRNCILTARTDLTKANSSITIDGDNKYSLSTTGNALIFVLDNDNVALTFKNLKIDHKGYDRFITFDKENGDANTGVNVVFDNVQMTASGTADDKCYPYGLFNLRASGALTMIDSTITLDVEKVFGGNGYGVIRLGNAKDGQTVEITMDNSSIDVSKTKDIAGIYVQEGSTADVEALNSTIKTNNKHAINVNSKGNLTLAQTDTEWSSVDTSIKSITNCKTMVDTVCYLTFTDAWNAAKESGKATTITLLNDCKVTKAMDVVSKEGTKITIDGDETYTLTTTPNAQMFMLGKDDVALTFKDLVIEHQGNDRFVTTSKKDEGVYTGVNVEFNNVQMTASGMTDDSCYKYGLFNLRASGQFKMINSTITLDVEKSTGGSDCGVIRLGNAGDGQTVKITMEDSTIDASKTENIAGINVPNGAKAEVKTTNSTIKTNNKYAINVNSTGSVTLAQPEPDYSCSDSNITSLTNCAAKIGNDYYAGFTSAWDVAKNSGNAITITLLKNCTLDKALATVSKAGTKITIDGDDKYSLTTTPNNPNGQMFILDKDNVELTFKDLVIKHQGNDRFITYNKKSNGVYTGVNVVFDNVQMTASGAANSYSYQYGLFNLRASGAFTMIDSTITLDVEKSTGGSDCGVIRLGNSNDGVTVKITMENSTIDASQTQKIAGINVPNGAKAEVKTTNSTIKTNDKYVIYVNATGSVKVAQPEPNWSCADQNITSITNCVVKSGDVYYGSLAGACKSAESGSAVYILDDIQLAETLAIGSAEEAKELTITNIAGKDITITRTSQTALFTVASGSTLTLGNSADDENKLIIDGGYDKEAETPLKAVPLVSNAGTFTLEVNATIQNAVTGGSSNNDNYRGGALNNKANATATISGTIRECSAFNGGAIYNAKSGTVIITEGAYFTKNTADGGNGGAIRNEGTVRITKATFINNEGKGDNGNGGVIYNTGTLTTTDAIFEENIAKKSGGAIYNATSAGKMTITGGVFTGNIATTENGGAIYIKYDSGAVSITNVEFTQNSSKNNNSAAIDVRKSITLSSCNIHDNVASQTSANAIYDINVGDSSNKGTLTLAGNTNTGVVYLTNGNVQVQADFTGETVLVPKAYTSGTKLVTFAEGITDKASMASKLVIGKVVSSQVYRSDKYYVDADGSLQAHTEVAKVGDRYTTLEEAIAAVQTSENTTIYLLNNATVSTTLEIGTQSAPKNITIVNAAGEDATITRTNKSALFSVASGSTLTLGSQDNANEFTVDGGYDKDAETPLKTVPLVSNAGTFTLEANATIQNAVTGGSSNNDNYRGGALNNKANATATISGTIRECSAFNGGAIYNAKSGTVIITEGACLTDNTADGGNGGAIRNEGTVRITKATFRNNEGKGSNGNGGVIYNTGTLTTTDAIFEANIAKKSGGAIYNATSAGKMTITGGVFTGNTATTENGGAIYVKYDSGAVSITNVEITQNSSKNNNSAAIDVRKAMTLSSCYIHDNVASETSTNAIYDINVGDSSNKGTLTLEGNTNTGVVYLTSGTVQVKADFTGAAVLVPKTYTEGTKLVAFAGDITDVSSMLDKITVDKDGYYIDSEGKLQKRSLLALIRAKRTLG